MPRWKRTQFATPLVVVLGCWGGSAERAVGPAAPAPPGGAQAGGAAEGSAVDAAADAGVAAAAAPPIDAGAPAVAVRPPDAGAPAAPPRLPPPQPPLGYPTKDEPCGRPPRSGCNPPPPTPEPKYVWGGTVNRVERAADGAATVFVDLDRRGETNIRRGWVAVFVDESGQEIQGPVLEVAEIGWFRIKLRWADATDPLPSKRIRFRRAVP